MQNAYKKTYLVKTGDLDSNRNLKPTALLGFLQDISTRHFETIIPDHKKHIWVIVSWELEWTKAFENPEMIKISTKPTFFRKCLAYRSYEICDSQGALMVKARSKWAYLSLETRTQAQIPHYFNDAFDVPVDTCAPIMIKLKKFSTEHSPVEFFKVYPSDIDMNHHVNNIVYLRWAMDAFLNQEEFLLDRGLFLKVLNIQYKKEMTMGEKSKVFTEKKYENHERIVSQQIENEKGEICAIIESKWTIF